MPSSSRKLNYDALRDFSPITRLAKVPLFLVIHPSLPVKSVADLIKLAKAKPGQISYAHGGTGSPQNMAGELFRQVAGVDLLGVPYKGGQGLYLELLSGQVSSIFGGIIAALPHVRAGKLRGLAVTSAERVATMPEFPTVIESGLPGFTMDTWYGLLAPAGTPSVILAKLNDTLVNQLNRNEVKEGLAKQGIFINTSTPEEFSAFMKQEIAKWAVVIKKSRMEL